MATGTKLMKEISDQFLICKLCQESFTDPKTLSCLHTFCCACIQQQYDEETSRPTRYTLYTRSVTCPLCRKKTDLPTGGVRRLPDNFLVSNLTEVLAKRCTAKVPPCEICHTVRPRSNDACSRCLDCDKLLCRACVELHTTTKVTQDHSLIDAEGQKDIECKAHPEETVRFYCEKCEECICVVCTFQEHKDHDVCSFNDGFAKHKVTLESLLTKSKARLTAMGSRLQVIEKYETLCKDLKETIRDLAISYTSQVRAREKELVQRVDELFTGGDLTQLSDSKAWLRDSYDSLQSACNLTEIVMRDRGVEMLLLKKEIQGKMDHLLSNPLPPELPPDVLEHLDVKFVPGEVRLGDVFLPGEGGGGEGEGEKGEGGKTEEGGGKVGSGGKAVFGGVGVVTNGVSSHHGGDLKTPTPASSSTTTTTTAATSLTSCDTKGAEKNNKSGVGGGKPCVECVERKRREAEEARAHRRHLHPHHHPHPHNNNVRDGEKEGNKPVQTTTTSTPTTHDRPANDKLRHNGHVVTTTATTTNAAQTHTSNNSNSTAHHHHQHPQHVNRARGTMTERQDVRTLKTQTDESCLRDTHLGQAAATGSTYPNTGAAIAAAFLRHKTSDDQEDILPNSRTSRPRPENHHHHLLQTSSKQTKDAEVATDISLTPSTNPTQTLTALCGAGGGGSSSSGASDSRRPDLLAETGSAASAAASSSSFPVTPPSVKIRSRKIQTEISALLETPDSRSGERFVSDAELRRSVCLAPGSANCPRPPVSRTTTLTHPHPHPKDPVLPAVRDAGAMTSFRVRIVPDTLDQATSPDEVTSHSVGMMTSQETRSVCLQTAGPRVVSVATGTTFEGQMSKSTSTLRVESVDVETAMPQVTHESRMTWTEAVGTSERATSTASSCTSDAATLTVQRQTSDFAVQMRPVGVAACTNTSGPKTVHRPAQTTPSLSTKATMPDPLLSPPTPSATSALTPTPPHQPPPSSSPHGPNTTPLTKPPLPPLVTGRSPASSSPRPLSMSSVPVGMTQGLMGPVKADKATETAPAKCVTRAVGPNVRMLSCRTTSTDTLSLLQVMDKETATPTVRTVDDWTTTPQPQMISTGVTPPRPAVLEVGVATVPITLMDQATHTEVTTTRESAVETCLVVCDSETLTDRTVMLDAQTEVEVSVENEGTTMAGGGGGGGGGVEVADEGCMTEQMSEDEQPPPSSPCKEFKDGESQCGPNPGVVNKEVNTTRHRRRVKEVQTSYSYTECLLCQHPEKLEQLGLTKTFTDTSTDPTPPDTHDVATMALSCLSASPGLMHAEVQTSTAALYDKSIATSFDFEEDLAAKPFLGLESQDAATSTESLPYIGLLSEIDVDELIVIPEANFELVSDSDLEDCRVPMVDGETLTEVLDYAEVGTQTLQPVPAGEESSADQNLICHEDDVSKHLSSIGVNTLPKVTFEKETSTLSHHLFSKGTMTFFVTKTDKATSTVSCTRTKAEGGSGQAGGVTKEGGRQRQVDNKVTMTHRTEQRDVAVETDPALVDGRITECISKLRNVSERLNSPTSKRTTDGEAVNEQPPQAPPPKQTDGLHPPLSAKPPPSPKIPRKESCQAAQVVDTATTAAAAVGAADDQQRQRQLQRFLVDTGVVLKPKDPSPVRKAQPITTLKPRTPVTPGDLSGYASRSLPRHGSLERQKVKMGSQVTPPSRLPLLRYNSAPGRIATVPTQTLLRKSGATSPRTSPSKIPVSQKAAPPPGGAVPPSSLTSSDSGPLQQLPSLPSITETQTPSSCSESSFPSLDSVTPANNNDDDNNADTAVTSCHSRSPSNVTSVSDTADDALMRTAGCADTAAVEGDGDDSSVSSAPLAAAPATTTPAQQATSSSSESLSKQKKEKKGFMQRLLSVKKKKTTTKTENSSSAKEKDAAPTKQDTSGTTKPKPQQALPPPSPQVQKKKAKPQPAPETKSKSQPSKPTTTATAGSSTPAATTTILTKPSSSSPVSSPAAARAAKSSSSTTGPATAVVASADTGGACCSAPPPSPPQPPHHYPPLPDPSKSPPAPKKSRPFVYVRQRILPIQQDNVEEVKEKKEKEKEDKEKDWDSTDSEGDAVVDDFAA